MRPLPRARLPAALSAKEHIPPGKSTAAPSAQTVSASGDISVGNHVIWRWPALAGQPVTPRLDGPLAHTLTGGTLARTVACPFPKQARPRLKGPRPGNSAPPHRLLRVTRHEHAASLIVGMAGTVILWLPTTAS